MRLKHLLLAQSAAKLPNREWDIRGVWREIVTTGQGITSAGSGATTYAGEPAVALLDGVLVWVLSLERDELSVEHTMTVELHAPSGSQLFAMDGGFQKDPDTPARDQTQVTGSAPWPDPLGSGGFELPEYGNYTVSLTIDGTPLGQTEFRVVKASLPGD